MADYHSSNDHLAASPRKSSDEARSLQRRPSEQHQVVHKAKGRRPTQYTDSYTPPSSLLKFKASRRSSSLDRSEDDGDQAREHLQQGNSATSIPPPYRGTAKIPTSNNTDTKQNHHHQTSSRGQGLHRRNSEERRSHRSSQKRNQTSPSTKGDEPTEQQIADYAGKRALMRLEQEFADSSAHNNYSDHSIESVRSVMDRRKLARVPQVKKRDLIIGEYLGRGNFCDVFEVTWILEDDNNRYSSLRRSTGSARPFSSSMNARTLAGSNNSLDDLESSMDSMSLHTSNDLSLLSDERGGAPRTRRSVSQVRVLQNRIPTTGSRDPNVLALKCLRPAVRAQPRKFVIGAEDLAHETALLACLDHPNIITLYGRAEGCFSTAFQMRTLENDYDKGQDGEGKEMSNEGYFIILDRLMATLTGRIEEWMDECRYINGSRSMPAYGSPPSSKNEIANMPPETNLREHLYKRLKVAYCIADALEYLHSRHVVFRDLKPANVGFDCNDCVKMFDFGFATSIAPLLHHEYQGYGPLTETCGTRRYMAPEVALKLGYGKEVDVYSFGMLLWEICVLEKPFDSIQSVEEFHDLVVLCGKRPSLHVDPLWTPSLKHLMSRCWSTDPLDRPTMVEVKSMLCKVLRDMNVKAMQNGGGSGHAQQQQQQQHQQQQQQQQHTFMNKWRRRVSI
ncbi:hypothetical protein ACHAXM_006264 [Skeletonema potamos]|jgi:serine/threonine protein kinase